MMIRLRKAVAAPVVLVLLWSMSSPASLVAAACGGGVVALTFDDGPTPETNAVLDELKRHNLRSTFFVLGMHVEAHPDVAQRIVREGHQIANHSWDHADLAALSDAEVEQQLRSTNDIIRQVTGVRPKFARPPFGSTNATVRALMTKHGLREVLWSQDSEDWNGAEPWYILSQLSVVPPGGTFLMHDYMPNTAAAIPEIAWYFNQYWAANPICPGRLEATTNVNPVLSWWGQYYFARAVQWPKP